MLLPQTKIAAMLGIKIKRLKWLARFAGVQYTTINNFRYYDWEEILEAIQRGKEVHREVR